MTSSEWVATVAFLSVFVLGMIWVLSPLWTCRYDPSACPFGCRYITHDGGPYGIPMTVEYNNPECPDHGKAVDQSSYR